MTTSVAGGAVIAVRGRATDEEIAAVLASLGRRRPTGAARAAGWNGSAGSAYERWRAGRLSALRRSAARSSR
jgi:hypothetical protein